MSEQPVDIKQWTKIILILSVLLATLHGADTGSLLGIAL